MGEKLSMSNIWVKRPGTGQIKAVDFNKLLGKISKCDIPVNNQIKWSDIQ